MMWLLLGALILFILLGGLKAFERASVASIKALLVWTAALAGLAAAGGRRDQWRHARRQWHMGCPQARRPDEPAGGV
jgi:hypothetical protein